MEQPSSAGPGAPQFRFSSPRQERIHRRLALIGQGLADFYRDACRLMADSSWRTTTHLVAHCFREIESAIRDVLLPHDYQPQKTDKDNNHRAEIDAILLLYSIEESNPVAMAWRKLADQDHDLTLS
jgi:hypothetical protein